MEQSNAMWVVGSSSTPVPGGCTPKLSLGGIQALRRSQDPDPAKVGQPPPSLCGCLVAAGATASMEQPLTWPCWSCWTAPPPLLISQDQSSSADLFPKGGANPSER